MDIINLTRILGYFDITHEDLKRTTIRQKVYYIAGILGGMSYDDQLRFLAKYDNPQKLGEDRLAIVWHKLKFSDVSKDLVLDMQPKTLVTGEVGKDGVSLSVTPQAPQTMNVTWSPDVKPWSME